MKSKKIIVHLINNDMRLDRYIKTLYPSLTQGLLEKILRKKHILVNKLPRKSSFRVQHNDEIEIFKPHLFESEPTINENYTINSQILATKLTNQYCIIHNEHILAINKPAELASQGGAKESICIDSALRYLNKDQTDYINTGYRLCHRLDKSTSGVFIIARNRLSAQKLGEAFRDRLIKKTYVAILDGVPRNEQGCIINKLTKDIDAQLQRVADDGDMAETEYKVIAKSQTKALVLFWPKTGRMHQLRVHAQFLGCPIAGDRKYGAKIINNHTITSRDKNFLLLHSLGSEIPESVLDQKYIINAEIPEYFDMFAEDEFGVSASKLLKNTHEL